MTDNIIPPITAGSPYYDDFNEEKKFLRMLFRPGYSVQARELTQLQDFAQKQIERFGDSIYQNGSIVGGAGMTYDQKVVYLTLQDNYNGVPVNVNTFINQVIQDQNTATITAQVVTAVDKTSNGTDPKTLIVKLTGSSGFTSGNTIVIPGTSIYAQLQSNNATGPSSVVTMQPGVFYINGFFVLADGGTIVLDKYDNVPNYKVGLQINDGIVDETADTTLLDPALGASNYLAPGATRYQIQLQLTSRTLSSVDDSKFIELMRIENGIIITQIVYPQYSVLEQTLARRTSDTNGDFTVTPFNIHLRPHVGDFLFGTQSAPNNSTTITGDANSIFTTQISAGDYFQFAGQTLQVANVVSNTVLTTSNATMYPIPAGSIGKVVSDNKYTIQIEPGKAYIKGFEFQTISPVYVTATKARTSQNIANYDLAMNFGQYFFANNANGFIDVTTTPIVDLHNTFSANISYPSTKIGTARVAAQDYVSGSGTNTIFRVHLYDIHWTANNAGFANVNSLSLNSSKTFTVDVSTSSKVGANAANSSFLTDSNFDTFVFSLPQQGIVPGSITNTSYTDKYSFTNQIFTASSGTATSPTLTLPSGTNYFGTGTLDSFTTHADWIVVVTNAQSSNLVTGQILDYANNNLRVQITTLTTAVVTCSANATFTAGIISTVDATNTSPKKKTLVLANNQILSNSGTSYTVGNTTVYPATAQVQISSGTIANSNIAFSLYLSDVANVQILQNVNTAADLVNPNNDITSRFTFNNGQRDDHYDYGSITLNQNQTVPSGNVVVLASYYTHQGTGYFTVDSYPNANTTGYKSIPSYTSPTTRTTYQLRDSIDFRPRRRDANTATGVGDLTAFPNYTFENANLFDPESQFILGNFGYYLGRVDKLAITKDRKFKILAGNPALRPLDPPDDPNGMTIYILTLPPYTFNVSDIQVQYIDNKRYTMRMIGGLEKRIATLEYYNTLNLLEQSATNMLIPDQNGLPRSKYGVLVDAFTGFQIADVTAPDLSISIDPVHQIARPYYGPNAVPLVVSSTSGVRRNGPIVTLPYTTEVLAEQTAATTFEPVTSYQFANWIATISLNPSSDYWYDTAQAPNVVVNVNGQNDNWVQLPASSGTQNPYGTVWNGWQINWAGYNPTGSYSYNPSANPGGTNPNATTVSGQTPNKALSPTDTGIAYANQPQNPQQSLGSKVINTSVIPYIRPQPIIFQAHNLRPNRAIYYYFDNVAIDAYVEQPDILTISANVPFQATSGNTETITTSSGYSAIVLAAEGNTLYVLTQTGNVAANTLITGSLTGLTANVTSYTHQSGLARGGTTTSIQLANTAPTTNIVGYRVAITFGTGAGQSRFIAAYNTATQNVTVDQSWTTAPDTTSAYTIGNMPTSPYGTLVGRFHLPDNPNTRQFRTGQRAFQITDAINGINSGSTTSGSALFYAQGILEVLQQDTISVQMPQPVQYFITNTTVVNNIVNNYQQNYTTYNYSPYSPDYSDSISYPGAAGADGGNGGGAGGAGV